MHVLGHLDHFGRFQTIFGPFLTSNPNCGQPIFGEFCVWRYRHVDCRVSIYDLLLSFLVKFHLECWWKSILKASTSKCLKSWFTSKPHSLPNELLAKTWCIVPDTNLKGDSTYLKPMLVYKIGSKLVVSCFYNLKTDLTICALILTSYFRPTSLCQLLMWREKLIIMPNLSVGQSLRHSIRLLDFKFINLSKGHFHHCILSEQLGKSFTVFRFSTVHALQHLVKRILHLEIFHLGNDEGWSVWPPRNRCRLISSPERTFLICDKTKGLLTDVMSRRQFFQERHESAFVIPTFCTLFVGAKIHTW